jgi:hypothetical protein
MKIAIHNVFKLNFGKVSTTNKTKPAQSTAKRVQSCRCEVFAVRQAMRSGRGGRCVAGWLLVRGLFAMRGPMRAGWLHSRGALRCTGCDAMRCDARDARQCAALHGMRCASRCAANWLRCNALRCTGCDARADALRTGCDAMRCARAGCIRAVQAAPCF